MQAGALYSTGNLRYRGAIGSLEPHIAAWVAILYFDFASNVKEFSMGTVVTPKLFCLESFLYSENDFTK